MDMPCESFIPDPDPIGDLRREMRQLLDLQRKPSPLKKELDLVTRLLCGILKKNPRLAKGNKQLSRWWKKHQRWDGKRKKRRRR